METKFRVWKIGKDGEMSLWGFEQLTSDVVWERKLHPSGDWEKGVFEWGIRDRFSGYFDKNKNEIYEGDILQVVNEALEEIRVICRFGHVYRKINGNEVDIAGFYFELPGKK
ncbi:MAG: YopX family protein, partial [Prevotella sp.]|nr:YopX family protein [Prevotella sp.]